MHETRQVLMLTLISWQKLSTISPKPKLSSRKLKVSYFLQELSQHVTTNSRVLTSGLKARPQKSEG